MATALGRARPASGRNPAEIRCQNPDCAAVLDVTAIPVEYETILRQLFRRDSDAVELLDDSDGGGPNTPIASHLHSSSHNGGGSGHFDISSTSTETYDSGSNANGPSSPPRPTSNGLGRGSDFNGNGGSTPRKQPQPNNGSNSYLPWDAFRDAAKRGDNVSFAVLLSVCASQAAGIDLPYCDACGEGLLKQKSKELADAVAERDRVCSLRDDLNARIGAMAASSSSHSAGSASSTLSPSSSDNYSEGLDALQTRHLQAAASIRAQLEAEEAALLAEIAASEKRLSSARAEKQRLRALNHQCDVLESKLWSEQRIVSTALRKGHAQLAAFKDREARARGLLGKLRLLSVHHDAFFIWHRGPFVTINGCRLGRLPGQVPVEWPEINAALGQAAMLLALIASRVGHVFTKFRVVPLGSFSRLAPSGDEKAMHELHYDGSYFGQRRFTAALKALLVCIAELGDFATAQDRSFRLPYAISPGGDKVHDLPIAYGSKDAPWTRALKLALTDLKWLLAWGYRQP